MKPSEFLSRATEIHGNRYDYPDLEFSKANDRITIVCPDHGEFTQRISDHLAGCGCPNQCE